MTRRTAQCREVDIAFVSAINRAFITGHCKIFIEYIHHSSSRLPDIRPVDLYLVKGSNSVTFKREFDCNIARIYVMLLEGFTR